MTVRQILKQIALKQNHNNNSKEITVRISKKNTTVQNIE